MPSTNQTYISFHPLFLKSVKDTHLRLLNVLLNPRQPPTRLGNLPNLTCHLLLLLNMRSRQILLQII